MDLREGGGNCLKYLERGWNRKGGRRHKDFKKGGQAGSMEQCLKEGGGMEFPYELCITSFHFLVIIDIKYSYKV